MGLARAVPWWALILGMLLAALAWPTVIRAHGGSPYRVLKAQRAGPYTVTAWADPDVGEGTLIVEATLEGSPVPAGTTLTVWVRPQNSQGRETAYTTTREGTHFVTNKVRFDAEGPWAIRLVLEGPAGRGDVEFIVQVTSSGSDWLGSLLCLLPGTAVALFWLVAVRRYQQAASTHSAEPTQ